MAEATENHVVAPDSAVGLQLVETYLRKYGFLGHHTQMYDWFARQATVVFEKLPEEHVVHHWKREYETLEMRNVRIGRPTAEDSGGYQAPVYPHDCHLRSQSYSAAVYADWYHIVRSMDTQEVTDEVLVYRDHLLGKVPIETGSALCRSRTYRYGAPGEEDEDPGSFRELGSKKFISGFMVRRKNRFLAVRHASPAHTNGGGGGSSERVLADVEIRPKADDRFRSPSTLWIRVLRHSQLFAVVLPFTNRTELPAYAILRIMGFKTRLEAARCIATMGLCSGQEPLPGEDDTAAARLGFAAAQARGWWWGGPGEVERIRVRLDNEVKRTCYSMPRANHMDNEVPDFQRMSVDEVLKWAGSRADPHLRFARQNAVGWIHKMKGLFVSEVFPHIAVKNCESATRLKRRLMAYGMWMALNVSQGRVPADNPDDVTLFQVESPATRVLVRVAQLARKMLSNVRRDMQSMAEDGHRVVLNELLRQYSFTYPLSSSMLSGDFTDRRKVDSHTSQEVTAAIIYQNRIGLMRDERSVKRDIPKSNKSEQPRFMMANSQQYLCPLNTPDNEATGLMLSLATLATISSGATACDIHTGVRHAPGVETADTAPAPAPVHGASSPPAAVRILAPAGVWWGGNVDTSTAAVGEDEALADRALLAATEGGGAPYWYFVNGVPTGVVVGSAQAEALATRVRAQRRRGLVPAHTAVHTDDARAEVWTDAEVGGLRRPVVSFTEHGVAGTLERLQECLAQPCTGPDVDHFATLVRDGLVEWLGPLEESRLCVRPSLHGTPRDDGIPYPPPRYPYCNFHQIGAFSEALLLVTFGAANNAIRDTFGTCMQRGCKAVQTDVGLQTSSMALVEAQKPLVATSVLHALDLNRRGNCHNLPTVQLAVRNNMEDSVTLSRDAIERGLGITSLLQTFSTSVRTDPTAQHLQRLRRGGGAAKTGGPSSSASAAATDAVRVLAEGESLRRPPAECVGRRTGSYAAVEEDGLPTLGARVRPQDVLIGKTGVSYNPQTHYGARGATRGAAVNAVLQARSRQQQRGAAAAAPVPAADSDDAPPETRESGAVVVRDQSTQASKFTGTASVFRVMLTDVSRLSRRAVAQVIQYVNADCGFKMSTNEGNKATAGALKRSADLVHQPDGTVPVVVMNPHSLCARETLGFAPTNRAGLLAAARGAPVNGTLFESFRRVDDALRDHPEVHPSVTLVSGELGTTLENPAKYGITPYIWPRQMGRNQLHVRCKGRRHGVNRQPPSGRGRGGGLRLGRMEVDALVGSGVTRLLRERMVDSSDPFLATVCGACGLFCEGGRPAAAVRGIVEDAENRPYCRNCRSAETVYNVNVNYSLVYAFNTAMASMVAMRMEVDPDPDVSEAFNAAAGCRVRSAFRCRAPPVRALETARRPPGVPKISTASSRRTHGETPEEKTVRFDLSSGSIVPETGRDPLDRIPYERLGEPHHGNYDASGAGGFDDQDDVDSLDESDDVDEGHLVDYGLARFEVPV